MTGLVPATQRTVDGLSAKHLDERKPNHVDGRDKPICAKFMFIMTHT